jgi:hypothetical protein
MRIDGAVPPTGFAPRRAAGAKLRGSVGDFGMPAWLLPERRVWTAALALGLLLALGALVFAFSRPGSDTSGAMLAQAGAATTRPGDADRVSTVKRRLREYWRDWSLPNDQVFDALQGYYGVTVTYYGKQITGLQVISEKHEFAERWPIRSYKPEEDSFVVNCTATTCTANGFVDWRAFSPARNQTASGISSYVLTLEITSDGTPRIVAESGSVITRETGTGTAP